MSPKATTEAEINSTVNGNAVPEEEIRRRAYEIYLERGKEPGRDLDDWIQAEQELQGGNLQREQEA